MSRLGLGGFFGLGGIVAFAIDGGDFAAHGAEIGGELAAVVNGVNEAELEKEDGGLLDHAAEVHDFDELFAGKFGKSVEISGVSLFVPCSDFERCFHVFWNRYGAGVKDAVDDGYEKHVVGDGDVAKKFVGGFGASVRLVVHFVFRDGVENFFGGAAFVFERAEKEVVEQEVSLFGGHVNHCESPCYLEFRQGIIGVNSTPKWSQAGTAGSREVDVAIDVFVGFERVEL